MNYDERADYILEALGKELARSAAEYISTPDTAGKILPFRKRPFFLTLRRGLVAVLIAAVCLTGFVPEVRAALIRGINYVVETFSDHIRLSAEDNPDTLPPGEVWKPSYKLSEIPDNFDSVYENITEGFIKTIYQNSFNEDIHFTFDQTDSRLYSISIDNEFLTHEVIEINGCEAHLFYELQPGEEDIPEALCYRIILIWQEDGTTLELSSMNMSREEILKIAEGVQKKKGPG